MSKNIEVDCTKRCRSRSHGQSLTSAITKRSIGDQALASYIKGTCSNFNQAFDYQGRTALHMAASRGRIPLMEWLIRHSGDAFTNARDRESGYTPLHRSIFYGQIHAAVSLLKIGVNTDILDKDDYKALEHAMLDRQYMYKQTNSEPTDVYVWGTNSNYTLGTGTQQQRNLPDLLNCFSRTNTSVKQLIIVMHTVGCPRTCLGFTNVFFFFIALVWCIICTWCAYNVEYFREINYTITKSSLIEFLADFLSLKLWSIPISSILLPAAVIALLTSCCGIIGAACQVKCAIKSYIFFMTIVSSISFWIFFISGVYNIYTDNSATRRYMKTTLQANYGKENEFITYFWNYIMMKYHCCGVDGYADFSDTVWHKINPTKLFPDQCCQLKNISALEPVSENCPYSEVAESYKDIGCFHALRGVIIDNKKLLIFYCILVVLLYTVLSILAFCISKGEPLVRTSAIPPKKPQKEMRVAPKSSETSLENMMFIEEPPKKVVKMVSAINPYQSYRIAPQVYSAGDRPMPRVKFITEYK